MNWKQLAERLKTRRAVGAIVLIAVTLGGGSYAAAPVITQGICAVIGCPA